MLVPYDVIAKGVAWQHTRLRTPGGLTWWREAGALEEAASVRVCVCVSV